MTGAPVGLEAQGRALVMRGAMLAMGACLIGGLAAVALAFVGQRPAAAGVAGVGGIVILVGVWMQARGFSLLKKARAGG